MATAIVRVGRAAGDDPPHYDEVEPVHAGDMATRHMPDYDGKVHTVHLQVTNARAEVVLHLQLYISYAGDTLIWQLECTKGVASRIRSILPAAQVKGRPTIGNLTYETQGPGGLEAPLIVALVAAAS